MMVLAKVIIILLYMEIKYILLSQYGSDTVVNMTERDLATKTYILVMVTIPTGCSAPARMLQIVPFASTSAVDKMSITQASSLVFLDVVLLKREGINASALND